ncbi:Abi family protein [Sphingobacterium multivorum]|nr:Abi family protein [Sphingobacterium multivorum]
MCRKTVSRIQKALLNGDSAPRQQSRSSGLEVFHEQIKHYLASGLSALLIHQKFNMYCFDRGLRKLVTAELEKIEVAIRAKMIYILSHQYGPFWYSAPNLFESLQLHLRGHLIESTPFLYTHKEL